MAAEKTTPAPLPINDLRADLEALRVEVKDLRSELVEQKALGAKRWQKVENFLAKFGTYYNSAGQKALFIVNQLVNSGANGIALTPWQGLIEQFALPIKTAKKGENIVGPCWVPEITPECLEEEIELFDAPGEPVGANS